MAEPTSTAPTPTESPEGPQLQSDDFPTDQVTVTQRALSPSEVDDLQREMRHSLPRTIGWAALCAWAFGAAAGGARRLPAGRGPQVVELLPESRTLWTVDGKPAPWRRTAG
jgi:hypothetical protein